MYFFLSNGTISCHEIKYNKMEFIINNKYFYLLNKNNLIRIINLNNSYVNRFFF